MPLSSLDIVFYYTWQATGPENNTLSLGGTISSYTIPDNLANNVFDDVTGDESELGDIEYRAIAVKNTSSSFDMLNTKVWIEDYNRASSGGDTIYFALENPSGSPSSIQLIEDESTSPDESKFVVKTGETVSWTVEGSPSSTLEFGTVGPGEWFGVWLKREVPGGASAFSNRTVTIKVQCETTASPHRYPVIKEYSITWMGNRFYVVRDIQESV
ncbi:MAG: hypothetical protein DRP09_14970 [Candidatus Thorarchaeota archaeon]|nr:MAG: hypothetical protein DRP09_14970 [Candidatus Thorarchaeota archaeon]